MKLKILYRIFFLDANVLNVPEFIIFMYILKSVFLKKKKIFSKYILFITVHLSSKFSLYS